MLGNQRVKSRSHFAKCSNLSVLPASCTLHEGKILSKNYNRDRSRIRQWLLLPSGFWRNLSFLISHSTDASGSGLPWRMSRNRKTSTQERTPMIELRRRMPRGVSVRAAKEQRYKVCNMEIEIYQPEEHFDFPESPQLWRILLVVNDPFDRLYCAREVSSQAC